MNNVRTRIAPSPTGEDIHIGNLYTALINFVVAKKYNGSFVIRIEDTDRTRFIKGAEEKILSSLKKFGLMYDEGPDIGGPYEPYRQSQRLEIYKKYAQELIEKGNAYYCVCSKERLDELRKEQVAKKQTPRYDKHCLNIQGEVKGGVEKGEQYVIRLNITHGTKVGFDDLIHGRVEFETSEIDDQVLIKSDGYPTYHMGVVIDDYLMKISHIIRAEEWISSTPKHIILYHAFGWELPIFAHVPILRNPDKSKLSKRKNPVWASWYLEQGYLPEAVLNYLALMGWAHPEERELFTLKEFIEVFDLKDVKPVGPVFDVTKLSWLNGEYIMNMENEELLGRIQELIPEIKLYNKDMMLKFTELAKSRIKTLTEFKDLVFPFLEKKRLELDSEEKRIRTDLKDALTSVNNWTEENLVTALKEVTQIHKIRFPVLYKIVIGEEKGLPLAPVFTILGKDSIIELLS